MWLYWPEYGVHHPWWCVIKAVTRSLHSKKIQLSLIFHILFGITLKLSKNRFDLNACSDICWVRFASPDENAEDFDPTYLMSFLPQNDMSLAVRNKTARKALIKCMRKFKNNWIINIERRISKVRLTAGTVLSLRMIYMIFPLLYYSSENLFFGNSFSCHKSWKCLPAPARQGHSGGWPISSGRKFEVS